MKSKEELLNAISTFHIVDAMVARIDLSEMLAGASARTPANTTTTNTCTLTTTNTSATCNSTSSATSISATSTSAADYSATTFSKDAMSARSACTLYHLRGSTCLQIIRFCREEEASFNKLCMKLEEEEERTKGNGQQNKNKNNKSKSLPSWVDLVFTCDYSLKTSVDLAAKYLDIIDPLRLLCYHSYCRSLCVLRASNDRARTFAERTITSASMHTQAMDDNALALLQRLRDDFTQHLDRTDGGSSRPSASLLENTDNDSTDLNEQFKISPKQHSKASATGAFRKGSATVAGVSPMSQQASLVNQLRPRVTAPEPVLLETISSSVAILRSLDTIFRVYVRGNALAGLVKSNDKVEIDGRGMRLSNFILEGPYMSFKGFINLMVDFNVVRIPPPETAAGKNFRRTHGSVASTSSATGTEVEPLLPLMHVAALFVECSASVRPALAMSRHVEKYQQMRGGDESREFDSWSAVSRWAWDPHNPKLWEISAGLNFMQFVDCLGKAGMLAYGAELYSSSLPSPVDQIEHLLTAFMGLADKARWKGIVEQKLRLVKEIVDKIKAGLFSGAGSAK